MNPFRYVLALATLMLTGAGLANAQIHFSATLNAGQSVPPSAVTGSDPARSR